MKKILAILLILSILIFAGCDDRTIYNEQIGFNVLSFPNQVGLEWQYERFDSLSIVADPSAIIYDTVTVRIVDSVLINSGLVATIWNYSFSSVDSAYGRYVTVIDDTVTFYEKVDSNYFVDYRLVFPLVLDKAWDGMSSYMIDSFFVTDVKEITYFEKNTNNDLAPVSPLQYTVEREGWGFNEAIFGKYDFIPGFGMVTGYFNERLWTINRNETWRMIYFGEYNPNPIDSFFINDFPFDNGSSWRYHVYNNLIDCFAECYDTCSVTIVDSLFYIPESPTKALRFEYPDRTEYGYIQATFNSILIQWNLPLTEFPLEFPLYVGKFWSSDKHRDTARVTHQETIYLPGNLRKTAFVVEGSLSGIDDYISYQLWLVKGMGIVRINVAGWGMFNPSMFDETWLLQEFTTITPPPPPPPPVFTIDRFPRIDGNWWNYQLNDGLRDCVRCFDTLHVAVTESALVAIWNHFTTDTVYSTYTLARDNTLFFYRDSRIILPYQSLRFPLTVGDGWSSVQGIDTSTVIGIEDVYLPAGQFKNAYHIRTENWCGDECRHVEDAWYVLDIGLVKKKIFETEYNYTTNQIDTNINVTWEMDYYFGN